MAKMVALIKVRTEAAKFRWTGFDNEVNFSRSYPKGAREGKPIFRTPNAQWKTKSAFHGFAMELVGAIGL